MKFLSNLFDVLLQDNKKTSVFLLFISGGFWTLNDLGCNLGKLCTNKNPVASVSEDKKTQ